MTSEPGATERLRAALAARDDAEVDSLLAQARSEARAEVVTTLRRLLVDDLLERAVRALAPAAGSGSALSLVGVVERQDEPAGAVLVRVGAIGALVVEVDPAELEDPRRLEDRVRAHNDLLLGALEEGAVVPIRFGTLFEARSDVEAWLARNEEALRGELERLHGRVEWVVRVTESEEAPTPEPVAAGASYLEQRLEAGERAAERARTLAENAEALHRRLARAADEAVVERSGGRAVLDSAYLVRTGRRSEFDRALADVEDELAASGLELRVTGPWPPFSFVRPALR